VSPLLRRTDIRLILLGVALAWSLHATGQGVATAGTVEALLQELRQSGVSVIYSSDLVPPDLAAPPPRANASPLQLAKDALAAHGLELRRVGPETYVVARAASPPASPDKDPELPLEEISVYASRYALEGRSAADPRELSSTDLKTMPGGHDDALRALRALPGLATNASARPYIRGSLSEDVLVRYDGIPLVDPFHLKNFQSLISAIDPAAIERIEVFSGGFPVRYGTRSGGVIDIEAPTVASGYEHRASASMISAGVSSIGHADELPLEWLGAIRHSTLDKLEPVEDNVGKPTFSDSLGRFRWTTEAGAWTAGWLLLDDRLDLGVAGDSERASATYRDEYVWLARDHRFGDSLRTRASLVVSSADRSRAGTLDRPDVVTGAVDEHNRLDGLQFSNDWSFEHNDRSSYEFGGEFASTRAAYRYSRDSTFASDIAAAFGRAPVESVNYSFGPKVVTYSVYAANRRKWSSLEAELGLRLDGQDFDDGGIHTQVSPRLNLRYDASPRLRVFASAGRFTQAQHVEEWRIEEGQQLPDSAQVSIHSVIGVSYEARDSTRWSAEAYTKRWTTAAPYFDSQLDPFSLLPDLAPDRVRIAPRGSEATGLELSVRRPLGENFVGWGTLAWSRVADDFGDGDDDGDVRRSWDQPMSLNLGLVWSRNRASVSAMAGWHSGWPRTPFSTEPFALGARNSDRWSDFYSLDLRASWTWTFARSDLTAALDLTNSTNRSNECCVDFERDDGELEPEIDHWLPTVANLGFTFRWRNP
jgi:hypothetical protein